MFKYRTSMDDFIIEKRSSAYPQNNSELRISHEDAKEFAEFIKEIKKELCRR